jgi:hypothetical protein
MNRTICSSLVLLLATATAVDAAPKKRPRPPEVVPFTAEAALGEAVDILTHGPLTLTLQCIDQGAALGVRTTVDGTMITSQSPHMFGPPGTAGTSILAARPEVTENGLRVGFTAPNNNLPAGVSLPAGAGVSVITPDGTLLSVPADTTAFGVQLYRHPDVQAGRAPQWLDAPDCFVTGTALLLRADVLP